MSAYLWLAIAIVSEVIATNALKATDGFTRLWPTLLTIVGYGVAFFGLSQCLQTMSVGVAYAIWAGLGIVLVALMAMVVFKQIPDWPAIIGMSLIIAGVVVINVFSQTATH